MDEIKLPQHVVNRIDRRWTARFAQMPDVRSTDVAIARKRRQLSHSRYLASIGRVIECAPVVDRAFVRTGVAESRKR